MTRERLRVDIERRLSLPSLVWFGFALAALLLLSIDDLTLWAVLVVPAAVVLALMPGLRPVAEWSFDARDLIAIGALYLGVLAAFRVAFTVFTTDNVLGLFLTFAFGLLLGVVGPIVYLVWIRDRDLRSLGIGLHRLPETVGIGISLAAVQFFMTLWGYELPAPVDWVPLLVMSLVVGFFEAVFFRGFIQSRLEASFGAVPAVAGAALLYALYHLGYGMGMEEMWFLFGLGAVYAIVFRLTSNVLVLWPLLTPLGAFFNNLQAGDIPLPWASILGFVDVGIVMGVAVWLASRRIRKRTPTTDEAREGILV
ncbi:MAG: CPBP family intramembrane glutamic endopeptidase [Acidimicrobiia bacterium]